jgi:glutamate synthase domain-containing protein 2
VWQQAALMGADEYGFGTVAMIATGCIMARICHTNNCPVGVASQREELRARMPGVPGDVVNFFIDVANEVNVRRPLVAISGLALTTPAVYAPLGYHGQGDGGGSVGA